MISVNNCGLFLLYIEDVCQEFFVAMFFMFRWYFSGNFFLLFRIPYLLVWLVCLSGVGLHTIILGEFSEVFFIRDYGAYSTRWILCIFLGGGGDGFWNWSIFGCLWVLWEICVIFCSFSFLIRMSKNGSSLKLCSMVDFILGCMLWNK